MVAGSLSGYVPITYWNRLVRIRMLGGVGAGGVNAPRYPIWGYFFWNGNYSGLK